MTKLIDADALLEALAKMGRNYQTQGKILAQMYYVDDVTKLVTNAPTVQREGWVSVPIEPTDEMIDAAFVFLKDGGVENIDGDDIRGAIRFAILSAPKE